ncbi:MAG TPA: hypothetical protein VM677_23080 [Actinokineospora sp.]|jgi:hypothetical protein|nr:hypothetical protein [Actinokineospora sp.]
MIDYNGRRFRKADGDTGTIAVYHQDGDAVWGEIAGGEVRHGAIAGTRQPDGTLHLGYTVVLADGDEVVCGHTVNTPEVDESGAIRLHEQWERHVPQAATGTSYLEEVR